MENNEQLNNFLCKIYNYITQQNYEEVKKTINNSEYRGYSQSKNILFIIKKIEYIDKINYYCIKNNQVEETYNLWKNFFNYIRIDNFSKAYEIISKINRNFNKYDNNYNIKICKLLVEQIINKISEKNSNYNKIIAINEEIDLVLKNNRTLNLMDILNIKSLLHKKIILSEQNNINYYFDKNAYYLIETIEQLLKEETISNNLFNKFESNENYLEHFYTSLENGDYPTVYSLLKNKNIYDYVLKNSDKIYPLLLIKLLNFFHQITKIKKVNITYEQKNEDINDKYQILKKLIVNNQFDEAFKYYIENDFQCDLYSEFYIVENVNKR